MARVTLQTLLDRSVSRMGNVNDVVEETILEVIKRAYKEGINCQVSSGLRTMEEQAAIYGQGRSSFWYKGKDYGNPSKGIVSNAKPGYSYHNFGLAVDYFLTSEDGSKAIWVVNNDWKRVAAIAKSLGFEWGGDWSSFKDYPHLQMTGGLSTADLRNGQYPKLVSKVPSPKSSSNSKFLDKGDKGEKVRVLQNKLLAAGEKLPRYGSDGHFGAETDDAVKAFQARRKVAVDGIVGPITEKELEKVLPDYTRILKDQKPMLQGNDVRAVQRVAGAKDDSHYGPKTAGVVEDYQKKYKLLVDGIVGKQTWGHMFG